MYLLVIYYQLALGIYIEFRHSYSFMRSMSLFRSKLLSGVSVSISIPTWTTPTVHSVNIPHFTFCKSRYFETSNEKDFP